MTYAEQVYEIIKNDSEGVDAIYQEYILHMVGESGLNALLESRLLETCGVVNGRQLYVLCKKEKKHDF